MNLYLRPPGWLNSCDGLSTIGRIANASRRMGFFEGSDGWMRGACVINSWHASTQASFGAVVLSFADGHAIMWDMTVWGAEQRTWGVSIDRIDDGQFSDWLAGTFSPGTGS